MSECPECGGDDCVVDIKLIMEGDGVYSRQPHRVVSCADCGYENKVDIGRGNNREER